MRLELRRPPSGRNMRAHFTICAKRPAALHDMDRRGGSLRLKRGHPPGPRMKRDWGCGAELTGRNMRAHFTICAKRPAASGDVERRRGTLKVKRGRPAGRRMPCGTVCQCCAWLPGFSVTILAGRHLLHSHARFVLDSAAALITFGGLYDLFTPRLPPNLVELCSGVKDPSLFLKNGTF
jgi:hypothetical protein